MARHISCIISPKALYHNLTVIKSQAPNAKIMAMVKANAYGHGLRSISQCLDGLVDALGVASIDEAMDLRQAGVKASIVLMEGVFAADELLLASEQGFQVVFHDNSQLNWLAHVDLPSPLIAWFKVNTGMGRLGFPLERAKEVLEILSSDPSIQHPIGVMSHFACSDDPNHPLNAQQIDAFKNLSFDHHGPKSICNSAAIFAFPDQHYDWIRPGLMLYGASPFSERSAESLGLEPVMTFHTKIIALQTLKQGVPIGYGARYICPTDMPVGIIAAGYGDGYPRTAQDGTPVLIDGIRCPLVGRVSMDMAAVDLRSCPQAIVGTEVTLWGQDLPVEDVATFTDNGVYDLVTGVQNRVKYRWAE